MDSAGVDTGLDTRSGEPDRVLIDDCHVVHYEGSRGDIRYWCGLYETEANWECYCGEGTVGSVVASDCMGALEAGCAVAAESNYCIASYNGLCWWEAATESYICDCDARAPIEAGSESCRDSLFATCSEACDIAEQGRCAPNFETGLFDCVCNDGRESAISDTHCQRAIGTTCEAICQTDQGVCYGGADRASLDCRCSGDSDFTNIDAAGYGREEACAAITRLCGASSGLVRCESTSENGAVSGECTIQPTGEWRCSCSSPDGSGSWGGSDGAERPCEERLRGVCPEAYE